MDPYIKRFKQLVLALALAGLFSHYAINSFSSSARDFRSLQESFFSSLLLSEAQSAKIDWFEDEFAREGYTNKYNAVDNGLAAAKILLNEDTYLFKGLVNVSGVQFRFENIASVSVGESGANVSQIEAAPDAAISAIVEESNLGEFLNINSSLCPSVRVFIIGGVDWQFACFHVWRPGSPNNAQYFWVSEGEPFWNGGDYVKDDKILTVARNDLYLSIQKLDAQIALIAERNGIVKAQAASRFFGFQDKMLSQRFKVPVIGLEANITDYYRLLAAVTFVLSVALLHSCVGLLERSSGEPISEPWLLTPDGITFSLTGIVRTLLLAFGIAFFFGALALPISALMRFWLELKLEANLIVSVNYVVCVIISILIFSCIYVIYFVTRLKIKENIDD